MGAYLSSPNRDKDSVDYDGKLFSYGACSMQGWRMSQEDAHNCCEDYDQGSALFAVYDGHGGSEVAQYTAMQFPDYIKNIPGYKEGKLSQVLEDAFLQFDATLTEESVIHKLKELAGVTEDEDGDDEEKKEEIAGLCEEADMPLEKLLERYQGGGLKQFQNLRKKENVPSPALRGKNDSEKNKANAADIRGRLDGQLVNGEVTECNGDHGKNEAESQAAKSGENPEVKSSENLAKMENEKGEKTDKIDKKSEREGKKDSSKSEKDSEKMEVTEKKDNILDKSKGEIKVENKLGNITEAQPSMDGDNKLLDEKEDSKITSNEVSNSAAEAVVEKSQEKHSLANDNKNENEATPSTISSSEKSPVEETAGSMLPDSSSSVNTPEGATCKDTNREAQVSSSSEGKSSTGQSAGSTGSSEGQGSEGAVAGEADSSAKVEASSSTGRKRSGRTGIIPAEGEDETSEEEETTSDEDSDEDVAMENLCEDDSEDDLDEDELDEFEEECGEEEEEEEEEGGVMYGGEEVMPGADSGCTSVVAILKGRELYVANAGDSRCVVCRDGKAVDMSDDHKPEDEIELQRILKAGGHVTPEGRVNGGLNLSRALGDHAYKRNSTLPLKDQMITALPDIRTLTIEDKDEFMILACDGIWNSLSSQDTVTFVRDRLNGGEVPKLSAICEEMFELILAPDTGGDGTGCDNMTCVIVRFTDTLRNLPRTITDSGAVKRPASEGAGDTSTLSGEGESGNENNGNSTGEGNACKKVKEGD